MRSGHSAVAGLAGTTVAHFWTALILLGVGWNLAFVGAGNTLAAIFGIDPTYVYFGQQHFRLR